MPKTTLNSLRSIFAFTGMLVLSTLILFIINKDIDLFGVEINIRKKDLFNYQVIVICILSVFWFAVLAVKKKIKAAFVGLAVALVNSFSTSMLLSKFNTAYGLKLPFDVITLSACIIMVFVLNKRYFSRIIDRKQTNE